jgi:hypothetical protein
MQNKLPPHLEHDRREKFLDSVGSGLAHAGHQVVEAFRSLMDLSRRVDAEIEAAGGKNVAEKPLSERPHGADAGYVKALEAKAEELNRRTELLIQFRAADIMSSPLLPALLEENPGLDRRLVVQFNKNAIREEEARQERVKAPAPSEPAPSWGGGYILGG